MRLRLLLIIILAVGASSSSYAAEPPRFKVGAILALTGPLSVQGVPFRNAMILAKEELDKTNLLELYFEDDSFVPRNTVTAAHKLLNRTKVNALVVFGTNQGLAVVDLAEREEVPFLSINVNRSVVAGNQNAYLVMPSLEALTALNVGEAERRGYKRVATAASIQDSCLLQQEIFEDSGNFIIAASEQFNPTESEFRGIAARIRDSNPDAVFLSTLAPQGSLLAKRLRESGFAGDLFGGIQLYLSEFRASGEALQNAWVVSADDQHAESFYKRYRDRFGGDSTDLAMYAYDSINLILEGARQGDVSGFLQTVKSFSGITGEFSADGSNGFTFKVRVKEFGHNGYK